MLEGKEAHDPEAEAIAVRLSDVCTAVSCALGFVGQGLESSGWEVLEPRHVHVVYEPEKGGSRQRIYIYIYV